MSGVKEEGKMVDPNKRPNKFTSNLPGTKTSSNNAPFPGGS
jgi:hypothetical protein